MKRWRDWWKQALADAEHARYALKAGHYEWACFAAQQAAEKALKACLNRLGKAAYGYVLLRLLQGIRESGVEVPADLEDAAKILDKFYIPTRYPNGLAEGAPTEFYTRQEAENAIGLAEQILRFCANHLDR